MINLDCFKAYDVRGKVPQELNSLLSYNIAVAYSKIIKPKKVVIGYDVRLSSPLLQEYFIRGLISSGVSVVDIKLCGTEEVYYHCFSDPTIDGGIMITASHNPADYNGIKMVGRAAKPISLDSELSLIRDYILLNWIDNIPPREEFTDKYVIATDKTNYIKHLLSYVDLGTLKPLKILVDPGNGGAGLVTKELEQFLPFQICYINENPNGAFPNGVPNPMIAENRTATIAAVKSLSTDFGISWDGDFDRCFLFDETGRFIEPYYLIGLLTEIFLKKHPGEKIIHDPRLTWNTISLAKKLGGTAIQSKAGHSFIKEMMRKEKAIYGGEISSHHYFRDFGYCDSGMIVWLIIAELVCQTGTKLSDLIDPLRSNFACSEEINYSTNKFEEIKDALVKSLQGQSTKIDFIDGISMEFPLWRFNIRQSNTENLIRINVETKYDAKNVQHYLKKLESIIDLIC
jgi:phosphomannomutase